MNNNDYSIIKCRLKNELCELLKLILDELNLKQQDFLESQIKDFIFANSHIILDKTKKDKK